MFEKTENLKIGGFVYTKMVSRLEMTISPYLT